MSFYTAAVGAHQQQRRLDVHANNIANVNNYGFQARRTSFSSLMTVAIHGIPQEGEETEVEVEEGEETVEEGVEETEETEETSDRWERLPKGAGAHLESTEMSHTQSAVQTTGRPLDYAIEGRGFFGLMDPVTGEFSYTRDGSFIASQFFETEEPEEGEEGAELEEGEEAQEPQQTMHWYLSDGMGRFVLGTDGRPIEVPPFEDLVVGDPLPIGVFDFINRNGMQSVGDNRFIPVEKNGQVSLGEGKLVQGGLEHSNTDLAYELAKVIESQRSFMYLIRMIQTSDEIITTVNDLR